MFFGGHLNFKSDFEPFGFRNDGWFWGILSLTFQVRKKWTEPLQLIGIHFWLISKLIATMLPERTGKLALLSYKANSANGFDSKLEVQNFERFYANNSILDIYDNKAECTHFIIWNLGGMIWNIIICK